MKVINRIAEREGVSPLDLETPLYEAVDPDALDALLTEEGGAAKEIVFAYTGYDVQATSRGEVTITKK